jgi:hypothetical protein
MTEHLRIAVEALRTAYPSASNPYWRTLSLGRMGRLLAGSFLLTSVAGFGVNLTDARHPFLHGLFWPVLIASLSTATLIARVRKPRWAPVLLLLAGVVIWSGVRLQQAVSIPLDWGEIAPQLFLDAFGIWVGVSLGSRLLMSFLTTEGVASVRMHTELALAHGIQSTLVPSISFNTRGFELFGASIPSAEMGGDLVDAIEKDGGLLAYAADVSGHGLPAGQLMGMLKTAIRVSFDLDQDLVGILENADRVLPNLKEPHMYATLGLFHFDNSSHKAEYALAGHGPILHYRKSRNDVVRLEMQQLPLGLLPGSQYHTAHATYSAGDIFILITDGVVEAANPKGEQFGFDRVEGLIVKNSAEPLSNIWAAIRNAAVTHGPQHDDQSGLLIRSL